MTRSKDLTDAIKYFKSKTGVTVDLDKLKESNSTNMKAQSMANNSLIDKLLAQLKISKADVDKDKEVAVYFNLIKDSLIVTKPALDHSFEITEAYF